MRPCDAPAWRPRLLHDVLGLMIGLYFASGQAGVAGCHVDRLMGLVMVVTNGDDPKPLSGAWS